MEVFPLSLNSETSAGEGFDDLDLGWSLKLNNEVIHRFRVSKGLSYKDKSPFKHVANQESCHGQTFVISTISSCSISLSEGLQGVSLNMQSSQPPDFLHNLDVKLNLSLDREGGSKETSSIGASSPA
jgi:hypothetical protein